MAIRTDITDKESSEFYRRKALEEDAREAHAKAAKKLTLAGIQEQIEDTISCRDESHNKKHLVPQLIMWLDSYVPKETATWTDLDIDAVDIEQHLIVTLGFLAREDDDYVMIAHNVGDGKGLGRISIPKKCITFRMAWPNLDIRDYKEEDDNS